jgi:hypothetical protein
MGIRHNQVASSVHTNNIYHNFQHNDALSESGSASGKKLLSSNLLAIQMRWGEHRVYGNHHQSIYEKDVQVLDGQPQEG